MTSSSDVLMQMVMQIFYLIISVFQRFSQRRARRGALSPPR
jgi:hypothetical protein